MIKSGIIDLAKEIKAMSEREREIEGTDEILNIVQKILEFNRQQQGQGLKLLTPNQMLSRLTIFLAQLKAGNNSEKLKNEIRQRFYSLCRSKKTYKTTLQKFGRHYLKMETIFMNSEKIKTNELHRFRLDLREKLNLKDPK